MWECLRFWGFIWIPGCLLSNLCLWRDKAQPQKSTPSNKVQHNETRIHGNITCICSTKYIYFLLPIGIDVCDCILQLVNLPHDGGPSTAIIFRLHVIKPRDRTYTCIYMWICIECVMWICVFCVFCICKLCNKVAPLGAQPPPIFRLHLIDLRARICDSHIWFLRAI